MQGQTQAFPVADKEIQLSHEATLSADERHRRGAYYTPPELARQVVSRALEPHLCESESITRLRICDPACGSGVFLVEALRYLAPIFEAYGFGGLEVKRDIVRHMLYGVDSDPGAVAATRAALSEECQCEVNPDHFVHGDALVGKIHASDACDDWTLGWKVFPHDWSRWPQITCWIGNPPFLGGGKISGTLGNAYRDHLRWLHAEDYHGNADLCAHFLRRADALTAEEPATISFIATNTIAQGDTRSFGLAHLVRSGWSIYDTTKSMPWPGDASVSVSIVHLERGFSHLFGNKDVAEIEG